jgi:5'-nucleotidase
MNKPCILITNDDGVHAPGLEALAKALEPLGETLVVAPDRERSASSQSLTLGQTKREEVIPGVYAIDGTPADCVHLGVVEILSPRRPDLIVSGINRGGNIGDDVYYSGTVGAAREGTFFGIPSIAMSLAARDEHDYRPAAAFSRRLAELVLERGLPERTLLNVNVPPGKPKGVVVTAQGHQHWQPGTVLEELDPRAPSNYWADERREDWLNDKTSDRVAIMSNRISITPLQIDATNHRVMPRLKDWARDLDRG